MSQSYQKTIHPKSKNYELPSKRQLVAVYSALVFSFAVVAAGNVHTSKSVVAPGTVESLSQAVSVIPFDSSQALDAGSSVGERKRIGGPAATKQPSNKGDIRLVTVRMWRASLADLAYAALRSDVEVYDDPSAEQKEEERRARRATQLASSELIAQFVASKAAGIPVTPTGSGALIEETTTEPAASVFMTGDVITEVGGISIRMADDIRTALVNKHPGEVVGVRFTRNDNSLWGEVTLTASPEQPSRALLGVLVSTKDLRIESPYRVEFNLEGIGGPSAGLALALEVYARLTATDLTGNSIVVATGDLRIDGKVLPVGGVAQKARAASTAGAEVLIVPSANAEEARQYAGTVAVLGVSSFEEALSSLAAFAGS